MVKVHVEQGFLEGELLDVVTGDGQYYSFKGIPYALAPVGKLRFKAPQPPKPWEGTRKATEHGPVCHQVDIFTNRNVPGSEDCLYLNVYTPDLAPKALLPVMVFIHGGGYKSGSGNVDHYGPDFLVTHEVVLITINYRLEVFGFLCLDTKEVPGNAAMKDQVAALKWVKENIANFGGDPKNITLFGESAGGASTALHLLSPMSKGLFQKAISMSGVPLCDWSLSFEPRKRAFTLGKILGFDTTDINELLEFLQSVPAEKLVNVKPCVLGFEEVTDSIVKMYHFTPVVEKDFGQEPFLTEEVVESLKKGKLNEVDLLIGHTSNECLVGISFIQEFIKASNRYPEFIVPRKILTSSTPSKILNIAEKIHKHYFGDKPLTLDAVKEFIAYLNDVTFTYPIDKFITLLPRIGDSKRYFYKFSCYSERNIYGKLGQEFGLHGASHLDDLMYLFDAKHANLKLEKTSREYKMVHLACAVFTNFAKYGNPTPDLSLGVSWPEYDNVTRQYADISETLSVGRLDEPALAFWDQVYEEVGVSF